MSDKPCSRENGFRVDCIKLYGDVMAENGRLKAEVERLRQFNDEAMAHIAKEERKAQMRQEGLEAEVERLRKAGDAMARHLVCSDLPNDVCDYLTKAWNAAKNNL